MLWVSGSEHIKLQRFLFFDFPFDKMLTKIVLSLLVVVLAVSVVEAQWGYGYPGFGYGGYGGYGGWGRPWGGYGGWGRPWGGYGGWGRPWGGYGGWGRGFYGKK
ncbi:unnamed protein product [Bursaphelenchus xylophilus]|uniref:(pine wood nematode) hypothetical protein n=1 Tax=Bursaphelenchus xylophilus TaxID=6326 RepID=A0A1I7SUX2_BURXY|nr:unnamed protein product [Bursaphelenchus xylophilus]CAG9125788.1 unnamed protein product [Bursaphelenchus xylophilus]